MLPFDFAAPDEQDDDEVDYELEEAAACLVLDSEKAIFEKPNANGYRHLKPLYIKGYVDGKPMAKMLVDGGAAVNLMPYSTFHKLGKGIDDLIKTNMTLKDFGGNVSEPRGAIHVELTIGSKTLPTTFFVIDGQGSYSMLLGRDWIHANCCIPSTMHQCLIQWQGNSVEIVPADDSVSIAIAELIIWEFEGIECLSGKTWDGDFLKVSDQGLQPIQARLARLDMRNLDLININQSKNVLTRKTGDRALRVQHTWTREICFAPVPALHLVRVRGVPVNLT